jgi:polyphosphate kinase 2 (PPK2 family)
MPTPPERAHIAQLSSLQQLLYASNRYAVLLIFQEMDAAGKDGAIKHVMSGVNPQGCQVFSFKHPSSRIRARFSLVNDPRSAGTW